MDAAGNLYGVTIDGGQTSCSPRGCGTIFELSPSAHGPWTEKVLFSGRDVQNPETGLVFDSAGNLYGVTRFGGSFNFGLAYQLTPGNNGTWTETEIHGFGNGSDTKAPLWNLVFDGAGNLYGVSVGVTFNCSQGCGAVFELTPQGNGTWAETVLHSFAGGKDGAVPSGGLTFDTLGNLYGATFQGGTSKSCQLGCGVIFKMTKTAPGTWEEQVLLMMNLTLAGPGANLIFNATGQLYGVSQGGYGNVFEVTP
jgi:hypothetical protein